jgi:CTP synthase
MSSKNTKYVVVTGGVLSGIGKGITAASLGALLNCVGKKVSVQKLEPYFNVDSGTLNPREHGECFVTADGKETDLDLGHYERFIGEDLDKNCVMLSGGLFTEMLARERNGFYQGKNVQLVPHLTNLIQEKILEASKDSDVHIMEIGGTVGDYEALSYIEAVRELSQKVGRDNCLFVHVAFVPFLKVSQEFKTKPLQNSVRDLREYGIVPDIIVARTEEVPNNLYIEKKVAPFVGVPIEQIIVLPNADTIYRVPETLHEKKIHKYIFDKFRIKFGEKDFSKKMKEKWGSVLGLFEKSKNQKEVCVGIVAKYLDNADSYYSVIESLKIGAWHSGVKLKYDWVDAEKIGDLGQYDGILVPGGFGSRGIEGKISAAQYALTNKVPYLGLCLGLQVATIGAARLGGLKDANSEEFVTSPQPPFKGGATSTTFSNVIYIMEDQKGKVGTGGTMRLGNQNCFVKENTLAKKVFGKREIVERHRHRFEVNRKFEKYFEKGGVVVSGTSKDEKLVELIEAHPDLQHPFYLATQSHPEFLSRPWKPHPMFLGFVNACKENQKEKTAGTQMVPTAIRMTTK